VDREKLLARIRKLYAMSRENDSSPHEAEIAMRRCQSLMARFGIKEADLDTSEFGSSKAGKAFRSMPNYVSVLGSAVALLHDCLCIKTDTIEFRGFSIDAEVATMTYQYLSDSMERSLKNRKRNASVAPGRSASFDYRVGFALAVLERARLLDAERQNEEAIHRDSGTTDGDIGQSLIVRKREVVKLSCMDGVVAGRARRIRYRNGEAHSAGTNDGANVSLEKQLGNTDQKVMS